MDVSIASKYKSQKLKIVACTSYAFELKRKVHKFSFNFFFDLFNGNNLTSMNNCIHNYDPNKSR